MPSAACRDDGLPNVPSGPGVARCFPGLESPDVEPESIVVGADDGSVRVIEWNPDPTLRRVELGRSVRLLGITDSEGASVLGVSERPDGGVDLVRVRLRPAPAMTTLVSEPPGELPWFEAIPALDGESFFVLRADRWATVWLPGRVERRRLSDGAVLRSREIAPRPGRMVLTTDGRRLLVDPVTPASDSPPSFLVLDASTLDTIDTRESPLGTWFVPAPDGRSLYLLPGWTGFLTLDADTLEATGWADTFRNPTETAFSPDGRYLYLTHQGGLEATALSVHETTTGQRCNWVLTSSALALAVTAGGRFVVTAGGSTITVVDTAEMEAVASLEVGATADVLVPLRPPPRATEPADPGPILTLLSGPPQVEVELQPSGSPIDPTSVRAFLDERDLGPLVRVDGDRLRLALGPCEEYGGENRLTISVVDTAGRVGRLLVEFERESTAENGFFHEIVVVFDHDRSPASEETMRCTRRIGALWEDDMVRDNLLLLYRIPTCVDVWDATFYLEDCPGAISALGNTPVSF